MIRQKIEGIGQRFFRPPLFLGPRQLRSVSAIKTPMGTSEVEQIVKDLVTLNQAGYTDQGLASTIKQNLNAFKIVTTLNHVLNEHDKASIRAMLFNISVLYKDRELYHDSKKLILSKQVSFIALVERLECLNLISILREGLDYKEKRRFTDTINVFMHLPLIEAASTLDLKFLREHWNRPHRVTAREIMVSIFQAKGPLPEKINVLLGYQDLGGSESQASLSCTDENGNNYLHWFFKEDTAPWHIRPEQLDRLIPKNDGHCGYKAKDVFTHKNKDGLSPLEILRTSNHPYAEMIIKQIMGCKRHTDENRGIHPGRTFY